MNTSLVIFALACTIAAVCADELPKCFKEGALKKKMHEEMAKNPDVQECKAKGGSEEEIKKCCMEKFQEKNKHCEEKEGDEKKKCYRESMKNSFKCEKTFDQAKTETLDMCLEERKKDVEEAISGCESDKENVCFCIMKSLKPVCGDMKHCKKGGKKPE